MGHQPCSLPPPVGPAALTAWICHPTGELQPMQDEGPNREQPPTEPAPEGAVSNGRLPREPLDPEHALGAQLRRMGDAFHQAHERQVSPIGETRVVGEDQRGQGAVPREGSRGCGWRSLKGTCPA